MNTPLTLARAGRETAPHGAEPIAALAQTMRKGRFLLGATLLGLIAPLAFVPIQGAVIAPGEITVSTEVKKIAHPRGGTIAQIAVSNGTRVKAGQLLMRLDTNVTEASATMAVETMDQLVARAARLRAERDGLAAIPFPADFMARAAEPGVAQAIAEERRALALNRATLAGQRAAIQAQIAQAGEAAASYRTQADVYRQQAVLIAEEREATERLWEKRYTTLQRRNELARAAVGLTGNVASAEGQASQLGSKVSELRQQMFVLEQDARRSAGADLSQVEQKLTELRQGKIVADDANDRNTIRAPYSGVVDKLAFTTIGGVVPAGETIMEIVPDHDPLRITARVTPSDVDQVTTGQKVTVRLSAFNSRTTPELNGHVTRVSADRSVDPVHGLAFYVVEVDLDRGELARLGDLQLRAGMPAEAFVQTGWRTLLSYLTKPLTDQLARAFR
jgi:HlyD family secretion protein